MYKDVLYSIGGSGDSISDIGIIILIALNIAYGLYLYLKINN